MAAQHTPGPWVAQLGGPEPAVCGSGYRVATLTGGEVGRNQANGNLIAAAPQFFEAAVSLIEAWDARTTVAQQIVTGKSDRELQAQAMAAIDRLRAAIKAVQS